MEKIQKLKKEKNAIFLVHNYQPPEIQDIADFRGDSLGLSLEASQTTADIIVFCGVTFMAETAKILSPEKTVLIPEKTAGCPMADTIRSRDLQKMKSEHPEAQTLCYVNTTAEVKAECDYCCTSANAVTVVTQALTHAKEIIFVPDANLAAYVTRKTGRTFVTWAGSCPVHAGITPQDIRLRKVLHPTAEIIVHPECTPEVIDLADQVLSTEGMSRYIRQSSSPEFILGTETGILYRLRQENPEKIFYPLSTGAVCPNMKKITLDKILTALEEMTHEVTIPEDIQKRAELSIRRMLVYRS